MPGHVLAKLKEKIKIPKETEAAIQKCSRKKSLQPDSNEHRRGYFKRILCNCAVLFNLQSIMQSEKSRGGVLSELSYMPRNLF